MHCYALAAVHIFSKQCISFSRYALFFGLYALSMHCLLPYSFSLSLSLSVINKKKKNTQCIKSTVLRKKQGCVYIDTKFGREPSPLPSPVFVLKVAGKGKNKQDVSRKVHFFH